MSSPRSPHRLRAAFSVLSVSLLLFTAACSASGGDNADDDGNGSTTTQATIDDEATTTTESDEDDGDDDASTSTTEADDDDFDDGDDDDLDGIPRDQLVSEIATGLIADGSVPDLDQPVAECLAGDMIDIVGVEKLQEIGMTGFTGIDPDAAEEFAESWGDCGYDLEGFMTDTMINSGASPEQAACVYEEIGDDTVEELLALGFAGASESSSEVTAIRGRVSEAMDGCR